MFKAHAAAQQAGAGASGSGGAAAAPSSKWQPAAALTMLPPQSFGAGAALLTPVGAAQGFWPMEMPAAVAASGDAQTGHAAAMQSDVDAPTDGAAGAAGAASDDDSDDDYAPPKPARRKLSR